MANAYSAQLPLCYKSTRITEGPDISDLYPFCLTAKKFIFHCKILIWSFYCQIRAPLAAPIFLTSCSSDHCVVSETASWNYGWASYEPQLLLPPVNSVYILYYHMHAMHK